VTRQASSLLGDAAPASVQAQLLGVRKTPARGARLADPLDGDDRVLLETPAEPGAIDEPPRQDLPRRELARSPSHQASTDVLPVARLEARDLRAEVALGSILRRPEARLGDLETVADRALPSRARNLGDGEKAKGKKEESQDRHGRPRSIASSMAQALRTGRVSSPKGSPKGSVFRGHRSSIFLVFSPSQRLCLSTLGCP